MIEVRANSGGNVVVNGNDVGKMKMDLDRVTAERDAALGREAALRDDLASANSDKEAYAQNAIDLRKRVEALQQRLTAADERADVLEELLRRAKAYGGLTPAWHDAVEGALKPADGVGDYRKSCEAAHKALSMENQCITPCNPDANEPPCSACFVRGCNGECMENL